VRIVGIDTVIQQLHRFCGTAREKSDECERQGIVCLGGDDILAIDICESYNV
jgi:hypothetical protein